MAHQDPIRADQTDLDVDAILGRGPGGATSNVPQLQIINPGAIAKASAVGAVVLLTLAVTSSHEVKSPLGRGASGAGPVNFATREAAKTTIAQSDRIGGASDRPTLSELTR